MGELGRPRNIKGFYSTAEAAPVLGLTKIGTGKVARREGWPVAFNIGGANFYAATDVHEYRDHQQRTKLVKALGWRGRGLYRADDIDIECPECGGFAVEWPAPPELSNKFMCLKWHEGKLLRCVKMEMPASPVIAQKALAKKK